MKEAVIVSGVRTAIARERGSLSGILPEVFAAEVIKEAVKRANIDQHPEVIDEVIFGACLQYQYACMARVSALKAGLPVTIPAINVDRQCGAGATTVNLAATHIWAGVGDVYLTGGVETMSRECYIMERPDVAFPRGFAPRYFDRILSTEEIGNPTPMGITAENIAVQYGISREEQDEMGYMSQVKAERAIKEGRFKEQIVPILIPQKKKEPIIFDTDEHPRFGITREALAKLRPVFSKAENASVTAGNSSGRNDAASALIVMSRDKAQELGARPMAKIVAFASAGVDPNVMGLGPIPAVRKLMEKSGLTVEQMDVIELNEAFAAQAIYCCQELGIDWRDEARFNPNGGAIALGHPIAASLGALIIKAMYELKRTNKRYGLITACCGGGQGVATVIENIS